MAERIQRKRTKGWRMPEGAVYVGRPSRWGNPYSVGEPCAIDGIPHDAGEVVRMFRTMAGMRDDLSGWLAPLRGRDLACWCPLDQPCRADVLLELANR